MSVRLDKWLHVARVFKTRTQATHAVDLNRVQVNGQAPKPHRNLAIGDRVEVEIGEWTRVLIVKELKDKPVSKEEARTLFEDLSPPRPESDPLPAAHAPPAGPAREGNRQAHQEGTQGDRPLGGRAGGRGGAVAPGKTRDERHDFGALFCPCRPCRPLRPLPFWTS